MPAGHSARWSAPTVTVVLPELISSLAEYRLLVFGALLLAVLWLAPEGVIGTLARRLGKTSPRTVERAISTSPPSSAVASIRP